MDLKTDSEFRQQMVNRGVEIVPTESGKQLAEQIGAAAFFECSAITQQNLKAVFDGALEAWSKFAREKRRKDQKAASCCEIM